VVAAIAVVNAFGSPFAETTDSSDLVRLLEAAHLARFKGQSRQH
jgi:hypothetical protein